MAAGLKGAGIVNENNRVQQKLDNDRARKCVTLTHKFKIYFTVHYPLLY